MAAAFHNSGERRYPLRFRQRSDDIGASLSASKGERAFKGLIAASWRSVRSLLLQVVATGLMTSPTQTNARRVSHLVALLLSAPACAAPTIGVASKPIPPGPVLAPSVRGPQPDAACMHPRDKRLVSFTLGPKPRLVDAVAWASSIVCKPFVLPGPLVAENRTLTMIAPAQMTMEDAYLLFMDALESAELVVAHDGDVQRIIEIGAAFPRGKELGGAEADDESEDSYVTVLLHLRDLSAEERAQLPPHSDMCNSEILPCDSDTVFITERRSTIERLLHRSIGR